MEGVPDLLLIGGGFFGYAREIVRALEGRGRCVEWHEDRPALDPYTKSAIRLAPWLVASKSDAYFAQIAAGLRGKPIADVLVIKGEALSCEAIKALRREAPQARFTLYFWDSYLNMPKGSEKKVQHFDHAFTFDPMDADRDPRLRYRPLFFLPEYANLAAVHEDIDLLFLGTAHTDRYAVLKRLAKSLDSSVRFERVLYVPSKLLFAARRAFDKDFWGAKRREFVFEPLGKTEIRALLSRTKAVVDIERSVQTGLTMRSVEMFGAGKKLITTNRKIVDADLYDPANIAVIDRSHPRISMDFLRRPYAPPKQQLLYRYSLEGWLDEVVSSTGGSVRRINGSG